MKNKIYRTYNAIRLTLSLMYRVWDKYEDDYGNIKICRISLSTAWKVSKIIWLTK